MEGTEVPRMLPDEVDERIVENEILERKTKKFIIQGRREDIVLKDDSRERFFDFEYLSGGREVLKKQYDNKDYLIEQVAGTKQSGKLPDSEDLDVSYRLARSSGVIFLPEAEIKTNIIRLINYFQNYTLT